MIDIVIYAVIAVLLIARLWATLGEKHDDEPQRPNPFLRNDADKKPSEDGANIVVRPEHLRVVGEAEAAANAPSVFLSAPPSLSLAGQIASIGQADPSFDEKHFIQGAKAAFALIVVSFAGGNLDAIQHVLAPEVLTRFKAVIADRQARGLSALAEVRDIRDAEITAARVEQGKAFVTVRFVSHQITVTYAADGSVVEGAPDRVEEIEDTWVFMRPIASSDPNWFLTETRA